MYIKKRKYNARGILCLIMKVKPSKLTPSNNELLGMDSESIKKSFVNHMEYSLGKDEYSATTRTATAVLRSLQGTG